MLRHHQLCKIRGDATALPAIDSYDQQWTAEDWLPRARTAGLRSAASKTPVSHVAMLAIAKVQAAKDIDIKFGSFADIESARNWLVSQ
jgi:hypothetical protein